MASRQCYEFHIVAVVHVQLYTARLSVFVLPVSIASVIACKLRSKSSLYHGFGRKPEM